MSGKEIKETAGKDICQETFGCVLCASQVPNVGYVGEVKCPGCGSTYSYDEGTTLVQIPKVLRGEIFKYNARSAS